MECNPLKTQQLGKLAKGVILASFPTKHSLGPLEGAWQRSHQPGHHSTLATWPQPETYKGVLSAPRDQQQHVLRWGDLLVT